MPFVVHPTEACKWHLAEQKGHFAPELISGPDARPPRSKWPSSMTLKESPEHTRVMLDPWGFQECTAAFVTLFWPWPSLPPKDYLLQVKCTGEDTGVQRAEVTQSPAGHWQKCSGMQFWTCSPCLCRFLHCQEFFLLWWLESRMNFWKLLWSKVISSWDTPNYQTSAYLGIKKVSIYLAHTHLCWLSPKIQGSSVLLISPPALEFYFGGRSEKAKGDWHLRRKGYITFSWQ